MKKVLVIALFSIGAFVSAQSGSAFGVRAGLNYGATGDLATDFNNVRENADSNLGYHFGFFAKFDVGPLYVRPELLYTRLLSDYSAARFNLEKIQAPFLVGINVIGPLNVFAGPSFQYTLDTELEENERAGVDFDFEEIEDRFTIGAQFGVSVYFSNLEVGLRYDRSFGNNIAEFAVNNGIDNVRVDTRSEQLVLALSLQL
ncbi:MAG: outer membrane beta-barrel protein [Nonlabens sp.]